MLSKSRVFYLMAGLFAYALLSQIAYAHGMSEVEKQAIIEGGNLTYMRLGATHMLSGYDHLAFVFGIVFFLSSFRDVVKYVTAFTLGHSVTLIFATFNAIQLNYFPIDAVIGLSVCYIAFANIDGFRKYLSIKPPNMLLMIVGLGLIHGFGLSTRLQDLPLSEDSLLLNIIAFNVGIELGQISALVVMLILVGYWRKRQSFQAFSIIANYGLILLGGLLFLMQMHGYLHTSNPEEFAVSAGSSQTENGATRMAPKTIQPESQAAQSEDLIRIIIPARDDKEYKIYLAKGATLTYSWQTDGNELFFDFHGEPANDTSGYFESFEKDTDTQSSGVLTATFDGTHGWYWKNNAPTPVHISLTVKGEYQRLDLEKKLDQAEPLKKSNSTTHDSIY